MYYSKNISSQVFRSLDYSNVSSKDRDFVKKDFSELQRLGKSYDIRLVSTYADVPGMAAIDIDARPLKEGLSLFKRIFRPIGKSVFQTEYAEDKNSLLKSVEEAIANLGKKMHK